jgi:hypothetical protein
LPKAGDRPRGGHLKPAVRTYRRAPWVALGSGFVHDFAGLPFNRKETVIELLIAGLVVFLGIHLVPAAPRLKDAIVARLGRHGWRGVMSVVSIAGFVTIVIGWQRAPFVALYSVPEWGHWLSRILMFPALTLLAAAYIPSNVKRVTRHPMLWATVVWAVSHLFANGDLRSLLLFGSVGAWALFDMWSANRRGAILEVRPVALHYEALVVVAGTVAWALFARFHGALFGVPVMGT